MCTVHPSNKSTCFKLTSFHSFPNQVLVNFSSSKHYKNLIFNKAANSIQVINTISLSKSTLLFCSSSIELYCGLYLIVIHHSHSENFSLVCFSNQQSIHLYDFSGSKYTKSGYSHNRNFQSGFVLPKQVR